MPDDLSPQNQAETEAIADLVWGDHPELKTVGDIREAAQALLRGMRSSPVTIRFSPDGKEVCAVKCPRLHEDMWVLVFHDGSTRCVYSCEIAHWAEREISRD